VREGDFRPKRQFLLQIDPTIYQANLQRAQAAMSQSEAGAVQARATRDQSTRALTRTKELREQNPNLISQEQLEQAQTASDIAEANLTASQHLVEQARAGPAGGTRPARENHLVAPMPGRVTRLAVERGRGRGAGNVLPRDRFVAHDLGSLGHSDEGAGRRDRRRGGCIWRFGRVTIDAFSGHAFQSGASPKSPQAILTGRRRPETRSIVTSTESPRCSRTTSVSSTCNLRLNDREIPRFVSNKPVSRENVPGTATSPSSTAKPRDAPRHRSERVGFRELVACLCRPAHALLHEVLRRCQVGLGDISDAVWDCSSCSCEMRFRVLLAQLPWWRVRARVELVARGRALDGAGLRLRHRCLRAAARFAW